MTTRLEREFFARDTIKVAEELIGKKLVHKLPDGARFSGRIVETEAYLGIEDPACHSYSGRRTPRTEVMFGLPGFSYIYFIYGMHFCFNVVTAEHGIPEAVLIRALAPLDEIEHMRTSCPGQPPHRLANGPGKLCRFLRLGRGENGLDLTISERLWIEPEKDDVTVHPLEIVEGPRIGLGDRHDAVHWPLRFGCKGHPALSHPKFPDCAGNGD